jgi:mannose-6-phosphate isomerase-like protein (cupin superfamily)
MDSVQQVSNPVGTATEFVVGERKTTVCYGTYNGDMLDQSFRFRISFVEHNDEFQMHSHEYSELVIVLAGRAVHLTDVDSHPLQTGDVVVINAGRSHGFSEAKGLQLCNIMYDPQQFLAGERDADGLPRAV